MKRARPQSDPVWDFYSANTADSPERRLWVAVILQAVMDALNQHPWHQRCERDRAIDWLKCDSQGFRSVCCAAGYHPNYIKRMAAKVIKHGSTVHRQRYYSKARGITWLKQ